MRKYISNYNLKTDKIKDIKIVHISDIHCDVNYNFKRLDFLVNEIRKLKPNYICITGDIIDNGKVLEDEKTYEILKKFLINLRMICKVIITLGNHEMKGGDFCIHSYKKIIKRLSDIPNLIVLDNETYEENNICFVGFNPSYEYYKDKKCDSYNFIRDLNSMNLKLNYDKYNVLLVHTPKDVLEDVIYNKVKDFDLILSGHTHGGLVPDWVKGNGGIISPERKWFPKNVRGHIIRENTHLIINSATIKFSNTSHSFKYLNFLYSSHINSINFK